MTVLTADNGMDRLCIHSTSFDKWTQLWLGCWPENDCWLLIGLPKFGCFIQKNGSSWKLSIYVIIINHWPFAELNCWRKIIAVLCWWRGQAKSVTQINVFIGKGCFRVQRLWQSMNNRKRFPTFIPPQTTEHFTLTGLCHLPELGMQCQSLSRIWATSAEYD